MVPNDNETEETAGRSETGILDHIENYIKSHDLVATTPTGFLQGLTFKLSPRNLDENELNLSVKLPSEDQNSAVESRGILCLNLAVLNEIQARLNCLL